MQRRFQFGVLSLTGALVEKGCLRKESKLLFFKAKDSISIHAAPGSDVKSQ